MFVCCVKSGAFTYMRDGEREERKKEKLKKICMCVRVRAHAKKAKKVIYELRSCYKAKLLVKLLS